MPDHGRGHAHHPLIALNKSDLVEPFARAWERLQPYRHMGKEGQHYGVLPCA